MVVLLGGPFTVLGRLGGKLSYSWESWRKWFLLTLGDVELWVMYEGGEMRNLESGALLPLRMPVYKFPKVPRGAVSSDLEESVVGV